MINDLRLKHKIISTHNYMSQSSSKLEWKAFGPTKKGVENVVADHLSRIPNAPKEKIPINDAFPDEHILIMCGEPGMLT